MPFDDIPTSAGFFSRTPPLRPEPPLQVPPDLTSIAHVRQAKQQLEGDILALIQQFERRTGVGVREVGTRCHEVTHLNDSSVRSTTQSVHLTLEPL